MDDLVILIGVAVMMVVPIVASVLVLAATIARVCRRTSSGKRISTLRTDG